MQSAIAAQIRRILLSSRVSKVRFNRFEQVCNFDAICGRDYRNKFIDVKQKYFLVVLEAEIEDTAKQAGFR